MSLRINIAVGRIGLMEKEELKSWRERNGLTQDELAQKLKVASNTVSRWELGTRKIPEFLELALRTVESELNKKD